MNRSRGSIIASYMTAFTLLTTLACGTDEQLGSESHALQPSEIQTDLRWGSPKQLAPDTGTQSGPAPTSGTTFFNGTAETGTEAPWSLPSPGWGARFNGDHSATQTRVKNGSWAYKYEVTTSGTGTIAHDVRTMSGQPQTSMGSANGRYLGGYYSWWMYIDSGYTTPAETTGWNLLMGWMTGESGAPRPIANIGLEVRGGVLELVFVLKNSSSAGAPSCYARPTLTSVVNIGDAWYRPTVRVPFPRNQWVHVAVYNNFAASNGVFKVWQDGVLTMDMTAPTMNLRDGWNACGPNTAGDMMIQFGNYGGHQDGVQRFYMDDFKVTDYRPVP